MNYRIEKESASPAYLQLYRMLRNDITDGVYKHGARMPSKRVLAEDTGTSVITVEHAYALLADEGYIESRERSGYFVCFRQEDLFYASPRTGRMPGGAGESRSGAEAPGKAAESGRTPGKAAESGRGPGAFSSYESFPFSVFAKTLRHVLTNHGEEVLAKVPSTGLPELREAIAAYLARSRGIRVNARQIVIGAGAEYLYGLVVQMLGRRRIYGLENPSYEKIRQVYEANGATCEMLAMGREGILSQSLEWTRASVLHVTPFNSFPSGITATASKRAEYIRWAHQRGAMILEDDYDSEFSEMSKAEETLFSLEPHRTVIYMNTFSRTIASAMRMGYMILPQDLTEMFLKRISFYACAVPALEQFVLTDLLNSGDFERHINRVRRRRRAELKQA